MDSVPVRTIEVTDTLCLEFQPLLEKWGKVSFRKNSNTLNVGPRRISIVCSLSCDEKDEFIAVLRHFAMNPPTKKQQSPASEKKSSLPITATSTDDFAKRASLGSRRSLQL